MSSTDTTYHTTFADKAETYQAALRSLFSGNPEETEADLTKLFTPTFTLTANDNKWDFQGFVKHIRWLRENLPKGGVTLETVQFLRDGKNLAERHKSQTIKPDGTVGQAETLMFAEVAEDGRVAWITELVNRNIQ